MKRIFNIQFWKSTALKSSKIKKSESSFIQREEIKNWGCPLDCRYSCGSGLLQSCFLKLSKSTFWWGVQVMAISFSIFPFSFSFLPQTEHSEYSEIQPLLSSLCSLCKLCSFLFQVRRGGGTGKATLHGDRGWRSPPPPPALTRRRELHDPNTGPRSGGAHSALLLL